MRVMSVTNLYPPHLVGGFERICARAVDRWNSHGWENVVLTQNLRGDTDLPPAPGVIRSLPPAPPINDWRPRRRDLARLAWDVRSARVAAAAAARHPVDVRVLWGTYGISEWALSRLINPGPPVLAFCSDYCLAEAFQEQIRPQPRVLPVAPLARLARRVGRAGLDPRRVSAWVFCSEAVRRIHEEMLGPLENGVVIHHGVEVPAARPDAPRRDGVLRVGAAGRLVREKGYHTLVAAAARLAATDPAARIEVTIHGPAVDETYAEALRAEAGAARAAGAVVTVGENLGDDAYRRWLAEQDVVVAPAEWEEPFSLATLEAMSAGRALVSTDRGGAAELLRDGENALVFPSGDAEALAAALGRLAADRDLLQRVAAAGWTTVAQGFRREQSDAALDRVVEGLARSVRGGDG